MILKFNSEILFLKNTVQFRAHSARILNVFSSVIDGLDKDTEDFAGIKQFVADGEFDSYFTAFYCNFLFCCLVGKFHAKRNVTKKAHNEVRIVLVEILSDVCKLTETGKHILSHPI